MGIEFWQATASYDWNLFTEWEIRGQTISGEREVFNCLWLQSCSIDIENAFKM